MPQEKRIKIMMSQRNFKRHNLQSLHESQEKRHCLQSLPERPVKPLMIPAGVFLDPEYEGHSSIGLIPK